MKLHTLSLALSVAAISNFASATLAEKPVPWAEVQTKDRDTKQWAFYTRPKGTDLRTVKPKYDECTVTNAKAKAYFFSHTFENNPAFEFQPVDGGVLGVNCIDCTTPMLAGYYQSKFTGYVRCLGYED